MIKTDYLTKGGGKEVMRIQAIEPVGERICCHGCGSSARWIITLSKHRPYLNFCTKCAEHIYQHLGELITERSKKQVKNG